MLARWGLIYILGVIALILGGVAGAQRQLISEERDERRSAVEKFEKLEAEASAARIEAASASRQAVDLKKQFDREKREADAKASLAAKSLKSVEDALAAKTEAETARKLAEAQLAAEVEAKATAQSALAQARIEADKQRMIAAAAVKDAENSRAELAKIKTIKSSETGSITPPEAAPKVVPSAVPVPPTKKSTAKVSSKLRTKPKPAAPDNSYLSY